MNHADRWSVQGQGQGSDKNNGLGPNKWHKRTLFSIDNMCLHLLDRILISLLCW